MALGNNQARNGGRDNARIQKNLNTFLFCRKVAWAQQQDTGSVSVEQVAEAVGCSIKMAQLALREPLTECPKDVPALPMNCRQAGATYQARKVRIRRMLKQIDLALSNHSVDQESHPQSYGYAGDLEAVEKSLNEALRMLSPGGR